MVLQSIRDRLHGIIAIFIFAILIIPFAFVGVSSYFTSGSANAVAVVNDQEISVQEFSQAFQDYRRRLQAQMGSSFDPDLFDQAVIRREFLDQMINRELMAQVASEAGLTVTNERLAEEIRSYEAFHVDGEFSPEVYQQRLTSMGLSVEMFQQDVRSSLVLDQLPQVLATSAISTRWEVEDHARLQDQQRAFAFVTVPAVVDEEAAVADEAVVAWYEEHQSDFMSEERVIIEYLELNAAEIGGEVEVTDEALRARFEEQQARFVTPESRLASHILIEVDSEAPQVDIETARKTAEELAGRARAGEDFAELARGNSQDLGSAETGGDLGWVEPGYMVQAFEDGLYALTMENPVSDPVQTRFGWHVIQLREIRPAKGMTFTEARDILLEEFQAEQDERRYLEQADRLIDIIYEDPTTLSAAADELGLEVREAGPFGRQGDVEGIAANRAVIDAAFSDLVLAQSSVSDPVDIDTNHIVLVLLKEHLPEAVIPLEDVREQVIGAVREQRAKDAAKARAEAMLARLDDGATLDDLAAEAGLEVVADEEATRVSPLIDAQLRTELFRMDPPEEGGFSSGVFEVAEGYAVVRLDRVSDGMLTDDDVMRNRSYELRIASASATGEAYGFMQMLRAQSEIMVYEDRLQ